MHGNLSGFGAQRTVSGAPCCYRALPGAVASIQERRQGRGGKPLGRQVLFIPPLSLRQGQEVNAPRGQHRRPRLHVTERQACPCEIATETERAVRVQAPVFHPRCGSV